MLANDATIAHWLGVVRAEYTEMPGLHLTTVQAQRLWSLDPLTCERLLAALVESQFLRGSDRDGFVRADSVR